VAFHHHSSPFEGSLAGLRKLRMKGSAVRWTHADVIVLGGGTGGFAAALGAARMGKSRVVVEEIDWLGRQLTSQGVPPDEHPWIEQFGCTRSHRRFRESVRACFMDHTARRLLDGRCAPCLGRERSEPYVRVAASCRLTLHFSWALTSSRVTYRPTSPGCLGRAGEPYEGFRSAGYGQG
jgi:FAD dependent oxidoreductase